VRWASGPKAYFKKWKSAGRVSIFASSTFSNTPRRTIEAVCDVVFVLRVNRSIRDCNRRLRF